MKEIKQKSAFFVETWRFSTQTMQLSIHDAENSALFCPWERT